MCDMRAILAVVLLGACGTCYVTDGPANGTSTSVRTFTASPNFPTGLFSAYYYGGSSLRQPQPMIFDEVLNYTYPLELTNPATLPKEAEDPIFFPEPIGQYSNGTAIVAYATIQLAQILANNATTNCTKCQNALNLGKYVAQRVPKMLPDLLVSLCKQYKFASNASCDANYKAENNGAVWTQVLALGDMLGSDGKYLCRYLNSAYCPVSYTLPSNTTGYFGPKPKNVTIPKASGNRVKVLHLSDMHLDPRFANGQEAACTGQGMCCRYPTALNNFTNVTQPAVPFGNFQCDSPYYLLAAALSSIAPLTGTNFNYTNSSLTDHFAWSIYTGDSVSHDPQNELSRNYTTYTEWSVYHMLKASIPGGPVFSALGNHDTNPSAIDAPHSLPGNLGQQQSWNFKHVSALWQHNNWITAAAAAQARMHYGAYSINHPKYPKLRVITINTDFWYRNNYFNYINTTQPDNSGILKFLADELQAAENATERVWIVGHVLSGYDGTNPLPNPTDLFYQIIDRYSPHVIAAIFFGHTHEDQVMINYSNNGTVRDAAHASSISYIGPSLTPLTNLNSGYRMYEVDTGDFQVYNSYTYFANVSTFASLNSTGAGPVFKYEYSAREAYPLLANASGVVVKNGTASWPATAPLNATFWHYVSEAMAANHSLVSLANTYQGKSSVKTPNCTSDACAAAKICYMRSGSVALGRACPQGFGSVQSKFTGTNF